MKSLSLKQFIGSALLMDLLSVAHSRAPGSAVSQHSSRPTSLPSSISGASSDYQGQVECTAHLEEAFLRFLKGDFSICGSVASFVRKARPNDMCVIFKDENEQLGYLNTKANSQSIWARKYKGKKSGWIWDRKYDESRKNWSDNKKVLCKTSEKSALKVKMAKWTIFKVSVCVGSELAKETIENWDDQSATAGDDMPQVWDKQALNMLDGESSLDAEDFNNNSNGRSFIVAYCDGTMGYVTAVHGNKTFQATKYDVAKGRFGESFCLSDDRTKKVEPWKTLENAITVSDSMSDSYSIASEESNTESSVAPTEAPTQPTEYLPASIHSDGALSKKQGSVRASTGASTVCSSSVKVTERRSFSSIDGAKEEIKGVINSDHVKRALFQIYANNLITDDDGRCAYFLRDNEAKRTFISEVHKHRKEWKVTFLLSAKGKSELGSKLQNERGTIDSSMKEEKRLGRKSEVIWQATFKNDKLSKEVKRSYIQPGSMEVVSVSPPRRSVDPARSPSPTPPNLSEGSGSLAGCVADFVTGVPGQGGVAAAADNPVVAGPAPLSPVDNPLSSSTGSVSVDAQRAAAPTSAGHGSLGGSPVADAAEEVGPQSRVGTVAAARGTVQTFPDDVASRDSAGKVATEEAAVQSDGGAAPPASDTIPTSSNDASSKISPVAGAVEEVGPQSHVGTVAAAEDTVPTVQSVREVDVVASGAEIAPVSRSGNSTSVSEKSSVCHVIRSRRPRTSRAEKAEFIIAKRQKDRRLEIGRVGSFVESAAGGRLVQVLFRQDVGMISENEFNKEREAGRVYGDMKDVKKALTAQRASSSPFLGCMFACGQLLPQGSAPLDVGEVVVRWSRRNAKWVSVGVVTSKADGNGRVTVNQKGTFSRFDKGQLRRRSEIQIQAASTSPQNGGSRSQGQPVAFPPVRHGSQAHRQLGDKVSVTEPTAMVTRA